MTNLEEGTPNSKTTLWSSPTFCILVGCNDSVTFWRILTRNPPHKRYVPSMFKVALLLPDEEVNQSHEKGYGNRYWKQNRVAIGGYQAYSTNP